MKMIVEVPEDSVRAGRKGADDTIFNCAVWVTALCASLLNLLNYQNYPLFSPEVAIMLVGLAIVGVVMGLLRKLAGPRIGFLFTSLFIAIIIDLNSLESGTHFVLAWMFLAIVAYIRERPLMKLTLAAFGAVLLFQFAALTTGIGAYQRPADEIRIRQDTKGKSSVRPPIIHLILDSYIGIDGMAIGPAELKRLATDQEKFYLQRGFHIYPQAYSRHVKTINSLPHILSYGNAPLATTSRIVQYFAPDELAYFSDLDAAGYRTHVIAPDFVDLCANQKLTHCRKFENSSLASMQGTSMNMAERAKVIAYHMLRLTYLPSDVAGWLYYMRRHYLGIRGRPLDLRPNLLPLTSGEQLNGLIAGLENLDYGEVRLAHLLIAHDPFILDARCGILPFTEWLDGHGYKEDQAEREYAYSEQVRCLTSRIAALLDALERTQAGRDAIVVLHGDHGSRLTPRDPSTVDFPAGAKNMIGSYSAFFAIRIPGAKASIFAQPVSLDELLGDFRKRDFAAAPRPTPKPPRVYLVDEQWIPRTMVDLPPMPRR